MTTLDDDRRTSTSSGFARGEASLRRYLQGQRPGLLQATPVDLVEAMPTLLPDVDRAVVTAEYGEYLAASFHEALRAGVDGWLDDDLASVEPWGFDLDDVQVPGGGVARKWCPVRMAFGSQILPGCARAPRPGIPFDNQFRGGPCPTTSP